MTLATLQLDAPPAAVFSVDECARGLEIVIGSAWSRARAGQASEELIALDAATRGIAGVLDLDRVLQLITDRVRELAHAQYAALGIVDQEGGIERFITSGISRAERERIGPPPHGHGLLGVIANETRPVRVHDVATDPRRYGFPANHPPMRSLLGVPVGAKGRSIGRLYLTNKQPIGEFTEDDERLVEMFALHAGIAIENARLHEQVQRLAIVEERERIGRDLHDGIIQSIYAVGLSLEDVPDLMVDEPDVARARVERAIDSLDQSIRDIRNFIFGLRPELLEQAGLVGGLAALADEFRVNSMVDVELDTAEADDTDLPPELTGQLLSIAREALSNIARHSKATRGNVHVETRQSGRDDDRQRQRSRLRSGQTSRRRPPGPCQHARPRLVCRWPTGRSERARLRHAYHRFGTPSRSIGRGYGSRRRMTDQIEARPLRLLVVDDHEVVRQGLVSLLERREHFQVVAEAGTAAEAVEMARKFEPDLVVMDVRLPDGSGIEACREIRAEFPAPASSS